MKPFRFDMRTPESHFRLISDSQIAELARTVERRPFEQRATFLKTISGVFGIDKSERHAFFEYLCTGSWHETLKIVGFVEPGLATFSAVIIAMLSETSLQFDMAKKDIRAGIHALKLALHAHLRIAEEARLAAHEAQKVAQELEAQKVAQELEAQRRAQELSTLFDSLFREFDVGSENFPLPLFERLQDKTLAAQYLEVFGEKPNLTGLRKRFSLTSATYKVLASGKRDIDARNKVAQTQAIESKREEARQAKETALAAKQWADALIHAADMPTRLGITKAEFDRWRSEGRIPVSKRKSFRKWGRTLETTLHHPEQLAHITSEVIESWRNQDYCNLSPQQRGRREVAARKAATSRRMADCLTSLTARGCVWLLSGMPASRWDETSLLKTSTLFWEKTLNLTADVMTAEGGVARWTVPVKVRGEVGRPVTDEEFETFEARVSAFFDIDEQKRLAGLLVARVSGAVTQYGETFPEEARPAFTEALKMSLSAGTDAQSLADDREFARLVKGPVANIIAQVEAERARVLLKLENYPDSFPIARSLQRTVHFRVGPTNSGKTHEALERLKAADSGTYLAPLRLLAMEMRDRLVAAGVPCSLITGEEHEIVQGACHTARTVEMLDPSVTVDVAVLDEIQMLDDEQRGWAWTAALVGAPAKELFVCGAPSVLTLCRKVVHQLGEKSTEVRSERKTPLEMESRHLSIKALKRGDALIAFTRKDVLTYSARLRQRGLKVATIYGALAPEVRRTESERFASGEADVVVATDAIGMGLNLPIRRVVFSTVHKYDGKQTRRLNVMEVNQIAGRAGRYGLHERGFVSALSASDLAHVRSHFSLEASSNLTRLPISASFWHIEQLGELLGTQSIARLLRFFANRISVQSTLFKADALGNAVQVADMVDARAKTLSLRDRYVLAYAPVTPGKPDSVYFRQCLDAIAQATPLSLAPLPDWLKGAAAKHLEVAEMLGKELSLYAWLSFKFPDIFVDSARIPEHRKAVSRYVERALLTQAGFGQTTQEAFETRQRRPRFSEGEDDWEQDSNRRYGWY